MARTIHLLLLGFLASIAAIGYAQIPQTLSSPAEITLGQAAIPLYGPWKFGVGDSPIDSKTGKPLWAEPSYDDSDWETVDLTPRPGMVDPWTNDPRFVPGWTSLGHPGYMGWAWYRITVPVLAPGVERLALEDPTGPMMPIRSLVLEDCSAVLAKSVGLMKRLSSTSTSRRSSCLPAASRTATA